MENSKEKEDYNGDDFASQLGNGISRSMAIGSVAGGLMALGALGTMGVSIAAGGLGAAVVTSVKCCRSEQRGTLNAYERRSDKVKRTWVIATEEGCYNVRVCHYATGVDARAAFDKIWCCRILYNPADQEVAHAGWNVFAFDTIRRVVKQHYFQ